MTIPNETPIDLSLLPDTVCDLQTGQEHPLEEDLRSTIRTLTLDLHRQTLKLKAAEAVLEEKAAVELNALRAAQLSADSAKDELQRVLKSTWPGGGFQIPVGDMQVSLARSTPCLDIGDQLIQQDDVDEVASYAHEFNGTPLFRIVLDLSAYAAALDAGKIPSDVHQSLLDRGVLRMKYRSPSFSFKEVSRKQAVTRVSGGRKG